ncbi:bifunctional enzyme CysN/CysC [Amycolatopsis bartoniae]|uniref:Adenylyl-sulfate kinase n=1 Tax=Amycolatopsis bartoniae TaxID=941986 RepID=A0A8H9J082_9PSEU|nr:adenylyl-sulfate kinase [Amycolatopsis bartoniae]MBB2940122.1 bifunctional enzyme CysN/CysC [Amycolatopsis bartoniae]TVT07701.1 adenylyl-sulfate kinase [Amycolatopsis bartoniae]GHF54128.1 adenylyl-sulfate kinase [Amycolatopsis bartoniae]
MGAVLRLVACGSVDDGKSTLIGRLLADTGSVPADQLEQARRTRRGGSVVPPGEIDYSLLTDGLEAEREQGITIDVGYRFLDLPGGRRVIIADAPGHDQHGANMAVAAATADLAVLLVDAVLGVRPATCRHLAVCTTMGVRSVLVAVSKLDAVGYDRAVFDRIAAEIRAVAANLGVEELHVVPVSAVRGDNVTTPSPNLPWYDGPTFLDLLSGWRPKTGDRTAKLTGARLPVQYVIRTDRFRGPAGTVVGGALRIGDAVTVAGTGAVTTVDRLLGPAGDLDHAVPGTPVTVVLSGDVDVHRGDVLVPAGGDSPALTTAVTATVVWTGAEPLAVGAGYLLLAGPRSVPAEVTSLKSRLDVQTGQEHPATSLVRNEIGTVDVTIAAPVFLESYTDNHDTGSFLLVDRRTGDTVGAGMVRRPAGPPDVVPQDYAIDRAAREQLKGQRGRVLWLTGLPGAGKSTIADALERRLHGLGVHTYVLDGDNVRGGLNRDLGFTPADRAENVRRVAEVAALMLDAGLTVIVALVSPFRADRDAARNLFAPGDFVEVWVDTPLAECARRDPKGLYARANSGTLPAMTGVGQGYEPPEAAEVVLDGMDSLDRAVARLVTAITG